MKLGQNLVLTPKYEGHRFKDDIKNAQLRIDELESSENSLNADTVVELNKLKAMLNDIIGYSSTTTADAVTDDTTITVDDASGFEAQDEIVILDVVYTIDSISENTITLTSGLTADVASGTEVTKNSTLNIDSINEKMQTLADIFSKSGTANDVFDSLVILANAWNAGGKLTDAMEVEFNSANGELNVDISSFGFTDITEYKTVGSTDNKGALKTTIGFNKLDKDTITVTAFDRACFVEDEIPYDASVENASFTVTIYISYNRPHLSFSITDEENNTTTVE